MNKQWITTDLVYFIRNHNSQPGDTDLNKTTKENHETYSKTKEDKETDQSYSEWTSERPQPIRLISF